jgi:DNA-binding NarL/FixJ family response regulator
MAGEDRTARRTVATLQQKAADDHGAEEARQQARFSLRQVDRLAANFSPKRRRVYQLLKRGLNQKRISEELSITPQTVSEHVKAIQKALKPFAP